MRPIEGQLTEEIKKAIGRKKVGVADAYTVTRYRQLVEHVAKLAYLNKDYLLFFRGQSMDYRNRANASTFYPSIYRGDYVPRREIRHRFDVLQGAARLLVEEFKRCDLPGAAELKRKKYIQWSVLQHYEVCHTPLIDLSHSLRVACSFAVDGNKGNDAYVFVFGLPFITNRISMNSEHDLVNVRLLSICPPNALRPYFQDGYVAGTEDVSDEYEDKSELDFNNRLIAKFHFKDNPNFWGKNFAPIPHDALYPRKDEVEELCKLVKEGADRELQSGTIGDFLQTWAELEEYLLDTTAQYREHPTVRDAIRTLVNSNTVPEEIGAEFDKARKFRNELVHRPRKIKNSEVARYLQSVQALLDELRGALQ